MIFSGAPAVIRSIAGLSTVALVVAVSLFGCGSAAGPRPLESPAATGDRTLTSGPSTAVSTRRTPDAAAEASRQVTAAQADYDHAYATAIAAPGNPAQTGPLLALYIEGSPARTAMANRLRVLADQKYAGRRGVAGYYVIERITVSDDSSAGQAVATVCTYDDGIVYDTANRSVDGKEIVVNDVAVSARTDFLWKHQGGSWKLDGGTVIGSWKGENRCPPR